LSAPILGPAISVRPSSPGVARGAVHPGTTIPDTVYIMFQMTFAIITPALIIGAYVERIKFSAVLLFSALWLIAVYAPVAHWVWGGGWLARWRQGFSRRHRGPYDSGNLRARGGDSFGQARRFSTRFATASRTLDRYVGAAMLWVGWFGFNAGSALTAGRMRAWPCW